MTGSPTPSPKLHHALLIGVNLYPKVDGDLQDLKAPRNDVIQWFKLLRRLDVPAADIHVLTSPVLTPEELDSDEVVCELASSDNVNRAVMAYIERARKLGDDAFGFIFLAGHGDYSNGAAYALYLSDYAGPPPRSNDVAANGVLVGWGLHLALSDGREGSRTTLVTDVCRASSVTDNQGDWDSLSPSPRLVILGATGAHRESYERCYDGTWHGQFTWSAMAILRNWPIGRLPHGRTPYLRITAETLRERMATLLSVFNAPGRAQVPTLFQTLADGQDVPTAAGPFLLPGVEAPVAAYAVDAPPHEFSGGTSDFTDSSGTVVGTIFVESVLQPNPNNTQPPPHVDTRHMEVQERPAVLRRNSGHVHLPQPESLTVHGEPGAHPHLLGERFGWRERVPGSSEAGQWKADHQPELHLVFGVHREFVCIRSGPLCRAQLRP